MAKFNLPRWLQTLVGTTPKTMHKQRRRHQLRAELLEDRLAPATRIWDGGGSSNLWSDPQNWDNNVNVPVNGDDLVFPAGAARVANSNDIDSLIVNNIAISGTGYALSGNPITLGNGTSGTGYINVNGSGIVDSISFNITLTGPAGAKQFFTVNSGTSRLTIAGQLLGNSGVELSKDGQGTLVLNADNSGFTGPISITEGSLNVQHALALGTTAAPTTVQYDNVTAKFGQLQVENVGGNIAEPIILNGTGPLNDGALLNVAGDNTWTGPVTLDTNTTVGARAGSSLTIQGVITDTGAGRSLTKEGAGTIILDPINTVGTLPENTGNTYRGKTFVNEGILSIRHSMALGNDSVPSLDALTGNDTIVQSFTNRSGTLQVDFLDNPLRIDPFATATGFTIPYELLTLNGPGFEGIHVVPKAALPGGNTVHGALNNNAGNNTWVQDISLWSGDSAVVGDATRWTFGSVLPTVGIGAESGTTLTLTGHINDVNLTGDTLDPTNLTNLQYSLIKTRGGRVVIVHDNSYRGKTEILAGYLRIHDSRALGTATNVTGNATFVFPQGTLEIEADEIPDSQSGTGLYADPPHALPHIPTDIIISTELIRPMGNGANGDGAIQSIRGINELRGSLQLQRLIPRGGVSFTGSGASIGVDPDFNLPANYLSLPAPFNDPRFYRSQFTVSGVVADDPGVGPSDLTKFGLGELVLTNHNTYTRQTYIAEGWITARNSNALGENANTFNNGIPNRPDTVQPETYIAEGAALVLKQTRSATPADISMYERIFVSGNGITHAAQPELYGTSAGAELNLNGAILNLSGNNSITGIITLVATGTTNLIGIGADIDATDPTVTVSSLTFNNLFRDDIVGAVAPYPFSSQPGSAGIEKLGRKRVTLQGQATFTGDNLVSEGVLRIQTDTALGGLTGTTTVQDGAALETAGYASQTSSSAPVTGLSQFAGSVIGFSSEFTTTSWSASQATGAPDTFTYGDIPTAWSALNTDGPPDPEFITLGFTTPVFATSVTVYETFNNGFVTSIDLLDTLGVFHPMPVTDTAAPNVVSAFTHTFPITPYLVSGVRIVVNPNHVVGDWEEIDAVELVGDTPPPPPGSSTIAPGGIQVKETLILGGLGNDTTDDPTHDFSAPTRVDTLTNIDEDNMWRAPITFASDVAIDTRQDTRLSLWKTIDGDGGMAKNGQGKLVIGGVNSYVGVTNVNEGTLNLQSSSALGGPSLNEIQTVTVTGSAGTFTLTFNGQTTAALAFNATAGQVQTALNALSSIAGVGGSVLVGKTGSVYTITFGGSLNGYDQSSIVSAGLGGATAVVATVNEGNGGSIVANDAQIELQGDITIGGESLLVRGNGPDNAPVIPQRWFNNGPGPINNGQTNGNEDVTGRVTGVVADPFDTNVLYLSSAGGGAWRSKNNGATWEPLIDNINGNPIDHTKVLFSGAIAVAPTDSNTIYVGLGEGNNSGDSYYGRGVLKSSDYGRTWTVIQPAGNAFERHTISKIVVDPAERNTIYVAVQGDGINENVPNNYGIWRLRNGTWVNLTNGNPGAGSGNFVANGGHKYTDLIVINPADPLNPNNRFVAFALGDEFGNGFGSTDNAIYLATDAAVNNNIPTWSVNSFTTTLQTVNGVPNHPRNGVIKLAANYVRAGNTGTATLWAAVTFPFMGQYFSTGQAGAFREVETMTAVYNYTPFVNTWVTVNAWSIPNTQPGNYMGNQGWYNSTIAVHPTNPNYVFVGGIGGPFSAGPFVWNGTAWNTQDVGTAGTGPHVDYHASAFDAQGRLLVGNDGGIWRMENTTPPAPNGAIWTNLNGQFLAITQFNGLDVHPFDPFFAIGGSQDNGTETYNDNVEWEHTDDGDGGIVRINNRDPNIVFHVLNGTLRRSTDGGATWSNMTPNVSVPGVLYFPFILDRVNPSRLIYAEGSNLRESLTSDQATQSFNLIGSGASVPNGLGSIIQIAVADRQGTWVNDTSFPLVLDKGTDSYDSDTIYVTSVGGATTRGVFVTKNHGSNWVQRNNGIPAGEQSDLIDIAVDPRNRDTAYVVRNVFGGGHVYVTTDAGQNWTNISTNLGDIPCWKVVVNPRNGDVYVGTDTGVYFLPGGPAGGSTWQRLGRGLPNVQIKELVLNTTTNMLSAGTYGRGLFQVWLDDSRDNGGAIRAVTGSSLWTGDVTLQGTTDLRAEIDAQVQFSGTIADDAGGPFTINKMGAGRIVFSGANTYTGLTDVQEGSLNVRNVDALGSASSPTGDTVVRAGAALELQADLFDEHVILNGNGIAINGHNTGALRNISNNNTFTGTLFLNSNATIGVDSSSQLTIGHKIVSGAIDVTAGTGVIDDGAPSRTLTKELTGTLVLNAANTYDGMTDVIQGIVRVEDSLALGGTAGGAAGGTQVRNGAQLQLNRFLSGPGTTVANETLTLSGTGIFGTGALQNLSGNNTWQGPVIFTGIQGVAAPPPPVPSSIINIGVVNAADILTIDGPISEAGVVIPAQPPLIPAPVALNSFGLTKVGLGKVILKGTSNNTYTGVTTVQTGVLNVQKSQALGTIAAGTVVNNGAALETEGNVVFVAEQVTLNGRGVSPANLGALRNIAGDNTWTGPVILNSTVAAASPLANPLINIGADAATDEVQTITVTGSAGSFTLTFNGQTTPSLLFDASAAQVQAALNGLSSIGAIGGSVLVSLTGNVYSVTFGGTLSGADQPQITAVGVGGASVSVGTSTPGALSRLTISGVVQDSAGVPASFKPVELHKVGDGTIVFPNANTYQGLTQVDNGILNIRNDGSLGAAGTAANGTIVNSGGTLQTEGGFTETNETLTLFGMGEAGQGALANNGGTNNWNNLITLGDNNVGLGSNAGTLIINGQITDAANTFGVTKVGPGTVQFAGGTDNEIQGLTQVNAGTLQLNKTTDSFNFDGNLTIGDNLPNQPPAPIPPDSALVQTLLSDQIRDGALVTINADGLLNLASNTETINTLVVNEGHLQTGATGVFTVGSSLSMIGGNIELGNAGVDRLLFGATATISATSSANETAVINGAAFVGLIGADPRTFNVSDGPLNSDLQITAPISGVGQRLIKDGVGKMEIDSNLNTYTGITEVHAGILQVDGTILNVELSGGTLGGNGTTGTVNSLAAGGTVNPGDSPGILHTGTVTWNANTTFFVELNRINNFPSAINPGADHDQLQVTGDLNLNGAHLAGIVDSLAGSTGVVLGDSFTIITFTGARNGTFAEGNSVFIGGRKFSISYLTSSVVLTKVKADVIVDVTSTGNPTVWGQDVDFTVTVTPEPGAGTVPASSTVAITLTNQEIQLVTVGGAAGTFTLTFNGQTTGALPFNASAGQVQTALNGLSSIGGVGGSVTVDHFSNVYAVTFGGSLNGANQPQMTGAVAGGASVSVATQTQGQTFGPVSQTLTAGQYSFDPQDLFGAILDVGIHNVRAEFQDPTNNFNDIDDTPTAADTHVQTINKADSTISLVSSSPGNTSVYGAPVTITAKLGIVPPGGTENGTSVMTGIVTFSLDGVQQLPASNVFFNGTQYVATFNLPTNLAVSAHTISAVYSGDQHFVGVPTTSDLVQQVIKANTGVVVVGAPSPSDPGQNVVFTVTVSAINPSTGTPTGNVVIRDGATVFGSAAVDGSGQVQFSISSLAFGSHTIFADYQGDSNFNTSTGSTPHVVRGGTTTSVVSSVNPSTYGQNVVFTATVSAVAPATGTPTGNVDFFDNGVLIPAGDDVALSGAGVAQFTYNLLGAGTHVITATYNGATLYSTSTGTLTPNQVVNKASTTTALTSSPANPTVYGQQINFTATISITAPGGGALSGTVDFLDNGVVIGDDVAISGNTAVFSTVTLGAGVHPNITAVYNGTANYNSSSSSAISRTVNKANTTTVLASTFNPSVYGQTTITATVAAVAPGGNIPTGTVTFFVTNTLTSVTTQTNITLDGSGVATLAPPLNTGTYTITATYNGTANYFTSNSTQINQIVTKANSGTALASSNLNAVYGEAVITATVSALAPGAGIPTGLVIFHVNNGSTTTDYPIALNSSGVATLPQLDVGSYSISVDYNGDLNFNASSAGPLFQTITPANSSVSVVSSANPSRFGQAVTFTATVSPVSPGFGVPPGTVTFIIDGSSVASNVSLVNGQATYQTSTLSVAGSPHSVVVNYSGSTNFNASSGTLSSGQTVIKGDTNTSISSSANPSLVGASVTFTATVSAVAPSAGTPTGFVTFIIDGVTQVPDVALVGGQAQLSSAFATQGNHSIVVNYLGDANFNVSSNALTQNVRANSTTNVASSVNPSTFGQIVTFTATVTPTVPLVPGGTVDFIIDGVEVASNVAMSGNTATFQISTLSVAGSPHTVLAHYDGDLNFFPSDGSLAGGQNVGQASTTTDVSSNTPTVFGQSAVFTATITNASTSATPAGTVTFVDQTTSTTLGTVSVSGSGNTATAAIATSSLSVGSHTIAATFNPSSDFTGSSDSTIHAVSAADTTTAVTSSLNPSTFQQAVAFTATVQAVAPGAGTPTGFVRFFIDSVAQVPDQSMSGGQATLTISTLTIGTHTVSAQYLGSTNFNGSAGNLATDQVVKANPVVFAVVPGSVVSGKPFTVIVHVRNAANTAIDTTFNGPVALAINSGPASGSFPSVNAVAGVATFNLTLNAAGSYTLKAMINGLPFVVSPNIEVTASSLIAAYTPAKVFVNRPFTIYALGVDVNGNVAPNYNGPFTLTIVKKPARAIVSGPKFGTFAGGFGQLVGLKVNKAGIYTFRVNGPNGLVRTVQINVRGRRSS